MSAVSLTYNVRRRSEPASAQPFCIGINDPLDLLPVMPGACATSWGGLDPKMCSRCSALWEPNESSGRRAIARGEQLFNTRQFTIDDVGGLNRRGRRSHRRAVRRHMHRLSRHAQRRQSLHFDGAEHRAERRSHAGRRICRSRPAPAQHDEPAGSRPPIPGRAMVTGKWRDIGKFKGPILRALVVASAVLPQWFGREPGRSHRASTTRAFTSPCRRRRRPI